MCAVHKLLSPKIPARFQRETGPVVMRYLINAGNACVLGQRLLPRYVLLLHRVCHCRSIFQPRFTPSPFIFERYSRRLERTRATYADKRQETREETIRGSINPNFSSTNMHTIVQKKKKKKTTKY